MTTEVRDTSPAPDPQIPPSLGPGLVTGAADDDPSGIATRNMNSRYGLRSLCLLVMLLAVANVNNIGADMKWLTVLLLAYPVTPFLVPEPWAISSGRG